MGDRGGRGVSRALFTTIPEWDSECTTGFVARPQVNDRFGYAEEQAACCYHRGWAGRGRAGQRSSNLPEEGKLIFLLDNMKHITEKSQCSIYQAYEVLHKYIEI